MACRKQLTATLAGWRSFLAERRAMMIFSGYDWMPPWLDWGVSWRGRPWFETERHPKNQRLDIVARTATAAERRGYARQALSVALDLYAAGWAHRDLRPANFFVRDDGGLTLKDFETLRHYPERKPSFLACYDLTGRGLPSPFRTAHMGLFAPRPEALGAMFGLGSEDVPALMQELLCGELAAADGGRPRDSMRLRFIEVAPGTAQRDTERRLARLGVAAESLAGQSVLHLGSGCGGMLFALQRFRPAAALGIERDPRRVATARRIAAFENFRRLDFLCGDVDFMKPEDIGGAHDTVFCLGLEAHVRHSARLFWLLGRVCRDTLYLEGAPGADVAQVMTRLKIAGFQSVECRSDRSAERLVVVARKSGPVPAACPAPDPLPEPRRADDLRVSVVMEVATEAAAAVEESVLSALAQPETGEVILVEAGPSSELESICTRLAAVYDRVKRIPASRRMSPGDWIGLGIQAAAGPAISFLQAGDVVLPGRFAGARGVFARHPDADGVHDAVDVSVPPPETGPWAGRPRKKRVGVLGRIRPEELFELLAEGGHGRLHLEGLVVKRASLERIGIAKLPAPDGPEGESGDGLWLRLAVAGRLYPGGAQAVVAEKRLPAGSAEQGSPVPANQEAQTILWRDLAVWLAARRFGTATVQLAARRYLEEAWMSIQKLRIIQANRFAAATLWFVMRHRECRGVGELGGIAAAACPPWLILRRGQDAVWSLLQGRWRKRRVKPPVRNPPTKNGAA
jgi:serine/threonine protein kinase